MFVHPLRAALAGAAFAAAAFSAPASAADGAIDRSDAAYRQDLADCRAGRSTQDEKTCLREAGARLQASRAHQLRSEPADQLAANALRRCDAFKDDDDRRSCLERLRDGSVTGSVAGGGQLREYREQALSPSPQGR